MMWRMVVREWKRSRNNSSLALTQIRSWAWAVGIILIFIISFSVNDVLAATNPPPLTAASQQEITCPTEVELEIVDLLNQERAQENLPPLVIDMRLTIAARRHNNDMAANNFFSHTGSDGSSPFDRIADSGYSMRSAGENIAAGYRTAESAVEGWMNSDGHRANILRSIYEHIGVGYVYDVNASYGYYWTTDFGSTNDVVQPPPETCSPPVDPTPTPIPEVGTTFADVPLDHPYHDYIEALYQAGYTAGCSTDPIMYCPDQIMTRAESAVFIERGVFGADYLPVQPSEQIFVDVPLNEWFTKWSTALWNNGYTGGCGTDPLIYCPLQEHTRAEGSVFFLRMMHGVDYVPPDPSGIFGDVSLDWWGAKWVEAAYER